MANHVCGQNTKLGIKQPMESEILKDVKYAKLFNHRKEEREDIVFILINTTQKYMK